VPTQAERTEATRGKLVVTARRLFAERGFADTSTEEILAAAAVSRGAMYHHFPSKTALFDAVFETVESELTAVVMKSALNETDPVRMLSAGFATFLDVSRRPDVQRIVMLEGPTVLGWNRWHEIDERYGFGAIKAVLGLAVEQGRLTPDAVEPWAHLLLGAIMQAGMVVARSDDPVAAKRAMTAAFERLIDSL
jgi:AcrR family transcriptional regulator